MTLSAQEVKVNALVLKEYRRTFHFYRKLNDADALAVLNWTLDTREGRDAYAEAVETVAGNPRPGRYS